MNLLHLNYKWCFKIGNRQRHVNPARFTLLHIVSTITCWLGDR